jgi:hypothetical protein
MTDRKSANPSVCQHSVAKKHGGACGEHRRQDSNGIGMEVDVKLCELSRDAQTPITVMGRTDEGLWPFRGVVQSIEHDAARGISSRWRVTMRP